MNPKICSIWVEERRSCIAPPQSFLCSQQWIPAFEARDSLVFNVESVQSKKSLEISSANGYKLS